MKSHKTKSRREFLRKLSLGAAAVSSSGILMARGRSERTYFLSRPAEAGKQHSSNDTIQLATIGFGIQGIGDTAAAAGVDGVKVVGACDLYTGRLDRAKELYGMDIFVTRDYREMLRRSDVDAVIIAVPDHWHQKIAIEAMKAGKAVYLEKPMIQKVEEGQALIQAEKDTKKAFQVGSQGISSIQNEKARELFLDGAIGDLNMVEIYNDRFSSEGAWQYPIPPDASPETIDFDTFLGNAPKVGYDPTRFFRWRNYQDYGTGVAGDLFVHSFTTLHYIINSLGPEKAVATGGIRYWKDGRDVPDFMMSLYDFPKTESHPAFNAVLRINFTAGNGGGGGFRLIGSEGELMVRGRSITLKKTRVGMDPSGYSLRAYTEATQKEILKEYEAKLGDLKRQLDQPEPIVFQPDSDYKGADHDHFVNFFGAMRGTKKIVENSTYGLRAAGAALLSNYSYFSKKIVGWDPVNMKLL